MSASNVSFFKPYPFKPGQKIRIEESSRAGDWLVVSVDEKKVILRCPISGKEFEWAHFCYLVEEKKEIEWPAKD